MRTIVFYTNWPQFESMPVFLYTYIDFMAVMLFQDALLNKCTKTK